MEKYLITVNGKTKAVVMSADEYGSLQETLDILSEPGVLDNIKQAEKVILMVKIGPRSIVYN